MHGTFHTLLLGRIQMPNPLLTKSTSAGSYAMPSNDTTSTPATGRVASLDGVIVKTLMMFGVLLASASFAWIANLSIALALPAAIIATIIVWVSTRRGTVNPALAFIYSGLEGLAVGLISSLYESTHPGIVKSAVMGTMLTAGIMFALWKFKFIKVDSLFQRRLYNLIIAYALISFGNIAYSLVTGNGGLFQSKYGWIACLVGCTLAAFSLISDFQMIEEGIESRLPESAEWNLSLGLMISIVWLYLEILRLLGRKN